MSRFDWRNDGRRIFLPILVLRPDPPSDLTAVHVSALLDTGATASGITRTCAARLGLVGLGKLRLMSAQGLGFAERYLFRVGFAQEAALPFVFEATLGFELTDDADLQAVLGMDILRQCDFTMRRDGRCSLVFG